MSDTDEQQLWDISQPLPTVTIDDEEQQDSFWTGGGPDDSFVQGSSEQQSTFEIDSPTPVRTIPRMLPTGRTSPYFQQIGQSSGNIYHTEIIPANPSPVATQSQHRPSMSHHHEAASMNEPPPQYTPPPIESIDDDEPVATAEVIKQREANQKTGIEDVPISRLINDQQGQCFKFKFFNKVQSAVFDDAYKESENLVVSAPTGSGKTTIFELAFLQTQTVITTKDGTPLSIYIAPTKALCSERQKDWQARMHNLLNIECTQITGDTGDFDTACRLIRKSNLVVFTPEKLDSITRHERWAKRDFYNRLKLIMIDEVHILREDRGATLEVIIARIRQNTAGVRIVALSATIPNIDDIARWIGQREPDNPYELSSGVYRGEEDEEHVLEKKVIRMPKAKVYQFGEEYRPVQLMRKVYGIECSSEWVLDTKLDAALFPILTRHAQGKPVLVFCATRKACQKTAELIFHLYQESQAKSLVLPWQPPRPIGPDKIVLQDSKLSDYASCGIAVHHAGLSYPDRRTIEDAFINGKLHMIVSTSTLAVGVNLPAHTVIIRGTTAWHGAVTGFKEYSDIDIQQMMGRAGRPQFDKSGTVIVICEQSKVKKYESMLYSSTLLESTLHLNLKEHLNSEIALGTIDSLATAQAWLKKSFLYIRLQQNPSYYSGTLENEMAKSDDDTWDEYATHYLQEAISKLVHAGFVEQTAKADPGEFKLQASPSGQIMRRSMIYHQLITNASQMLEIMSIEEDATLRDLLEIVARAQEFQDLRIRPGDAKLLNQLRVHSDTRFQIHRNVKDYSDKVFLLMQAQFGNIALDTEKKTEATSPLQTQMLIFTHAQRIAAAIIQIAFQRGYGGPLRAAIELYRTIAAKAWEDTAVVFRQIDQIGPISIRVLEHWGIRSFEQFLAADQPWLQAKLNKPYKAVREMKEKVKSMPRFHLTIEFGEIQSGKPPTLLLKVDIQPLTENMAEGNQRKHGRKSNSGNWNFSMLFLRDDDSYVMYRKRSLKQLIASKNKSVEVGVPLDRRCEKVICHYGVDEVAGCSGTVEYITNLTDDDYPKSVFDPPVKVSEDVELLKEQSTGTLLPTTEDAPEQEEVKLDGVSTKPKASRGQDTKPSRATESPTPKVEKPDPHRHREDLPDEAYEMITEDVSSYNEDTKPADIKHSPPPSDPTLDWDVNDMFADVNFVSDSSSAPQSVYSKEDVGDGYGMDMEYKFVDHSPNLGNTDYYKDRPVTQTNFDYRLGDYNTMDQTEQNGYKRVMEDYPTEDTFDPTNSLPPLAKRLKTVTFSGTDDYRLYRPADPAGQEYAADAGDDQGEDIWPESQFEEGADEEYDELM
ncbi:hypothetical protein V865_000719 [Kwoniella europaea PYCC6329]|uniref:DNA 3'-5' helicase n=1 Tax=Kwoniella europaea PYCC6329 TaxID=1423913 RepID=A0AAX4KAZ9_9TREE